MSRVVGLDLSLTGTGIASIGEFGWDAVDTVKTPASKVNGHERLDKILDAIVGHALGADLAVIEGPSFGSQGNALHQMGGLWWLVTHRLHRLGLRYVVVTPSQVKKYVTGNGNADKDLVIIKATQRYPDAGILNNNEADAVVLAAIGKRLLGEEIEESMPKVNLSAMEKIEGAA